jgi:putative oxidoreductase
MPANQAAAAGPGEIHAGGMIGERLDYIVPAARVLFAAIFVMAAPGLFGDEAMIAAAARGVPFVEALVPLAGLLALLGGLSVAFGFKARIGAAMLITFLVPVTVMMHDFWALSDPAAAKLQQVMFMKNITMLGGALLVLYHGAGPISLDARDRRDRLRG